VTCHDAHERLSDLLDDALEPAAAAVVEAHLAECAECRRELERLRATVGLLQRVEAPRAPAGFVDRVMDRAYPSPWYRRLGAWLFVPVLVKLPVEAAAVVLIAGLAIFLWERTPELRDAARMERSAPASSPSAPAAPSAPAPTIAPEAERKRQDESQRGQFSAVPRASSTALPARRPSFPASVEGHLTVSDRVAADRSLADLISRVGGSESRRRQGATATVVEILIPEARYDEFIRSLQALGSWSAEGQPTTLPLDPPQIPVTVHIQ